MVLVFLDFRSPPTDEPIFFSLSCLVVKKWRVQISLIYFVAAFHNHLPAEMSSDPATDATVSSRDSAADAAVDATQETTGY